MSDNMPDFDSMTPEEIQTWMESLAKRQGASEGFTTAADMEVAEIDPDSVVIDEPGYVPYGQESKQPAETKPPAPVKAPEKVAPEPEPVQPAAQIEPEVVTPPVAARAEAPPVVEAAPPEPVSAEAPVDEGALAWLESLAADQGEGLFNLDLSELPEETTEPTAALTNPMNWLEDLARSQVAEPSLERLGAEDDELPSEKLDPFAEGVNSMEWMETLAKRQGARPEELTTPAGMNIPQPEEDEVEEEEYEPFSFDTPPAARRTPELENPADWLTSLAGEEGYSEEGVLATQKPEEFGEDMSPEAIQQAIANGTVTREQMQVFLDRQSEQLAQEPEIEMVPEFEDEEPLEPAEMPDWLSELKPEDTPAPSQPIEALFEEAAPVAAEMPDWLKEDSFEEEAIDLESIFEPDEEAEQPIQMVEDEELPYEIEVDSTDPWVEAFDLEYEQGQADITAVPEWYEQNLNDPDRIAAVEEQAVMGTLEEAVLPPENELPAGQQEGVPDWATGFEEEEAEVAPVSTDNVFEEMPDWLKEVEASVSPEEVPDWLVETIAVPEEEVAPEVAAPPVQEVVAAPPPKPTPAPAPTPPKPAAPTPPARITGSGGKALESARDKEQSGDLEGALAEYDALIRASSDLDAVVADLTLLVKSYKTTPAVYRVLGDGLMRQGKLQAALNTYREALNQI